MKKTLKLTSLLFTPVSYTHLEQFLFTKEKGSLFNVKAWMKLLVKKSTLCYGNENRNRNLED